MTWGDGTVIVQVAISDHQHFAPRRRRRSSNKYQAEMDYEQSHQELVKCVVVGDTAVGMSAVGKICIFANCFAFQAKRAWSAPRHVTLSSIWDNLWRLTFRLFGRSVCFFFVFICRIITILLPDQYRIHKEVLERSWEVVDGVNVSLRLWDTFGDHDKDRRFAYGR